MAADSMPNVLYQARDVKTTHPECIRPYVIEEETGIRLKSHEDDQLAIGVLILPETLYLSWHTMFPAGLERALRNRLPASYMLFFLVKDMPNDAPHSISDKETTVFFSGYDSPLPVGEWSTKPPKELPVVTYAGFTKLIGYGEGRAAKKQTVNASTTVAASDEQFLQYVAGLGPAQISKEADEVENTEEAELTVGGVPVAEIVSRSQDIETRCAEWWAADDTLDKIADFVQESHYGDRTAIKMLLLAAMQHRIKTISEMTYISLNADSGGGKSDLVQAFASILPHDDVVIGGASAKFLPRMGERWDGKIIVYDDQQPDAQNIEYIKICNGACIRRPVYNVLEKTASGKHEPVSYPLPLRLCFIVARVDTSWGPDYEQVLNRMLPVYLDESTTQKGQIRKRMNEKATVKYTDNHRKAAEIMQQLLWKNLPEKIWVDVSNIGDHIDCGDIENRMYGHLLNMILCNAVYRQWPGTEPRWAECGREWKDDHEPIIYAEKADAIPIIDLFNLMLSNGKAGENSDPNAGGLVHKFTKNGKRIHDAILKKYRNKPTQWESVRKMAEDLNIPRTSLQLGLYGRKGSADDRIFAGIISQMPGLDGDKYTEYNETEDGRKSRTCYAITWNPNEYWNQTVASIKWKD